MACPYNATAVDLRLGCTFSRPRRERPFSIDLMAGKFADLYNDANYDRVVISLGQAYRLDPGAFVLALTLERVALPIQSGAAEPTLAARVEGRSSLARCGMLVHFTAPTIHAGFDGNVTLEIINLGPTPILLTPGSYVCQLIVEEVLGVPFRNDSQFQGQKTAGGPG